MDKSFWWKNTVIYEVYVDKFAKNFRGMSEKLPYLKELGIDCIWLLPHYPSPMVDDGYDVSDYMNIRNGLGTLDDFKKFVQKSHDMGIRVSIDLVLNHVSVQHPWFREASSSEKNPKRDFFLWSKTAKEFPDAVNPFAQMKPSNWITNPSTGSGQANDYYFATFYPQQADLNWDNPEVFIEMMKIVDFWIDCGVDGFRFDAAPYLIKREETKCVNLPETHALLKKIRSHVESYESDVILIAEVNGPFERIVEYFGNGDECHMIFNFHLMSAMFMALKRDDKSVLEKIVKNSSNIPDNCQWATFLRNHDELTLEHISPARREELLKWTDPEKKYTFENRGASMRLAEIFKGDKEKILGAFKMLMEAPGSPVIYYGDEIGMRNLDLAQKPADSRKYVRGNFEWQEADRQAQDPASLFNALAKLIKDRA